MQLVTLTAPDGHRERWDMKTTYLALLSWYSYLKDTDNAKERQKIVDRINQITNNDPETLKRLIELTKLFVDGQLSYKNMKG